MSTTRCMRVRAREGGKEGLTRGTAEGVRAGSIAADAFLGETEVSEADVAPRVKQDVLRFQVPIGREEGREGGKGGREGGRERS